MAELHARSINPVWSEDDFRTHTDQDICLGMGSPLMGFIVLRHSFDQAEILTLVADPSKRRAGLGRSLVEESFEILQYNGAEILFLEVAEDNTAAIELYRAVGFEQFGRRPAYYKRENGRVAALSFRKRLDA